MKTTSIRMPKDLYNHLKESAENNHRSINSEMIHGLTRYTEQEILKGLNELL